MQEREIFFEKTEDSPRRKYKKRKRARRSGKITLEELMHSLKQSSLVYKKFSKEYPAFAEDDKRGKKRRMKRKSGKIKSTPAENIIPGVDRNGGIYVHTDHKPKRPFKHELQMRVSCRSVDKHLGRFRIFPGGGRSHRGSFKQIKVPARVDGVGLDVSNNYNTELEHLKLVERESGGNLTANPGAGKLNLVSSVTDKPRSR